MPLKFWPGLSQGWIACYVLITLVHWIAIYPVDSIIQPLNNGGLVYFLLSICETESTLHMLGRNEIQEAIHRTSNPEKLENDLITALSHFIGQSRHTSKCYKINILLLSQEVL